MGPDSEPVYWHQVSVSCTGERAPEVAAVMERAGAAAVSYVDPVDAGPGAAVYEPRPGLGPLWRVTRVHALFQTDPRGGQRLQRELALALGPLLGSEAALVMERIAERDWAAESQAGFVPMSFGRGLWVCPSGAEPAGDSPRAVVRLDPGVAFGSGAHPTTRLCLEWLGRQTLDGLTVLDYGCGSGVLGIAAALLGAGAVWMVDQDPQAVRSAAENAERNAVGERVRACAPQEWARARLPYQVAVANILLEPLVALAPWLAARAAARARICLAGVLEDQAADLMAAFRPWFRVRAGDRREDWRAVEGTRSVLR